ncbi:fumarate reductase subunit C [Halieaceae bacterium IMCC14734]|uniref:Fumarate reductase subunit C n=1 Tax=Candidatus Litorirhabdus singularis TaxID=2518993 RepID=A0ABT3TEF0_9GAMM|nr:hypothetical protein [Candidatus Litorirhabdus singularis]MCX2980682.1 fumarate reductase subunit C [Candidatus Litorirhabdus singularis]
MTENHEHKQTFRKPYQHKQSRWWWLQNRFFTLYLIREATAVWVLLYCLLLLSGLVSLSEGEAAWSDWLNSLSHPAAVGFQMIVLTAVVYHAVTWFKLAPKIMVVRIGTWTMPERLMLIGQWLGLLILTAALLGLAIAWGA